MPTVLIIRALSCPQSTGESFRQAGRLVDAVTTERKVLNIEEATKGPNSEAVIQTLGLLGQLYFDLQNESAAMEVYEQQIRLDSKMLGHALQHAQTLTNVALGYADHRQFDRAIELTTEALDIVGIRVDPTLVVAGGDQEDFYFRTPNRNPTRGVPRPLLRCSSAG